MHGRLRDWKTATNDLQKRKQTKAKLNQVVKVTKENKRSLKKWRNKWTKCKTQKRDQTEQARLTEIGKKKKIKGRKRNEKRPPYSSGIRNNFRFTLQKAARLYRSGTLISPRSTQCRPHALELFRSIFRFNPSNLQGKVRIHPRNEMTAFRYEISPMPLFDVTQPRYWSFCGETLFWQRAFTFKSGLVNLNSFNQLTFWFCLQRRAQGNCLPRRSYSVYIPGWFGRLVDFTNDTANSVDGCARLHPVCEAEQ